MTKGEEELRHNLLVSLCAGCLAYVLLHLHRALRCLFPTVCLRHIVKEAAGVLLSSIIAGRVIWLLLRLQRFFKA